MACPGADPRPESVREESQKNGPSSGPKIRKKSREGSRKKGDDEACKKGHCISRLKTRAKRREETPPTPVTSWIFLP
jgi:hypothetical protein